MEEIAVEDSKLFARARALGIDFEAIAARQAQLRHGGGQSAGSSRGRGVGGRAASTGGAILQTGSLLSRPRGGSSPTLDVVRFPRGPGSGTVAGAAPHQTGRRSTSGAAAGNDGGVVVGRGVVGSTKSNEGRGSALASAARKRKVGSSKSPSRSPTSEARSPGGSRRSPQRGRRTRSGKVAVTTSGTSPGRRFSPQTRIPRTSLPTGNKSGLVSTFQQQQRGVAPRPPGRQLGATSASSSSSAMLMSSAASSSFLGTSGSSSQRLPSGSEQGTASASSRTVRLHQSLRSGRGGPGSSAASARQDPRFIFYDGEDQDTTGALSGTAEADGDVPLADGDVPLDLPGQIRTSVPPDLSGNRLLPDDLAGQSPPDEQIEQDLGAEGIDPFAAVPVSRPMLKPGEEKDMEGDHEAAAVASAGGVDPDEAFAEEAVADWIGADDNVVPADVSPNAAGDSGIQGDDYSSAQFVGDDSAQQEEGAVKEDFGADDGFVEDAFVDFSPEALAAYEPVQDGDRFAEEEEMGAYYNIPYDEMAVVDESVQVAADAVGGEEENPAEEEQPPPADPADEEMQRYLFLSAIARQYGNMCQGFEALDIEKKGRISVHQFITACVRVTQLETDIERAKQLFHILRGGRKGKVHLTPDDFAISKVEWEKFEAAKTGQAHRTWKKKMADARKNDLLGMRVTNYKILPDQVGRVVFPGGLHVQNWKINPKVKDLMQKNRSLVEELNLKSILVEELVSKCETLQREKADLAETLSQREAELAERTLQLSSLETAIEEREDERVLKSEQYSVQSGTLLRGIVECCERNNRMLEWHSSFIQDVAAKVGGGGSPTGNPMLASSEAGATASNASPSIPGSAMPPAPGLRE